MIQIPSRDYYVYGILDACYMLKLARNAFDNIQSVYENSGGNIQWSFFPQLCLLQDAEGFTWDNKFSAQHLQFEKHKMGVRFAAETFNSSVADATEFLDISIKLQVPQFKNSQATVNFIRIIDRAFAGTHWVRATSNHSDNNIEAHGSLCLETQ